MATDQARDQGGNPADGAGDAGPARILYLDPDAAQLRVLQRALKDEDLVVRTAATAAEGLRVLDEQRYAVVLADVALPEGGGLEFLGRVARLQPEVVLLLTLQRVDPEVLLDAVNKVGVFRILPKPWDGSQVRNAVRRAVVQHRHLVDQNLMLVRLNRLNEKLQRLNRELDAKVVERTAEIFLSLCNALDLRDTDTQWHSRRVALYARRLAVELGIVGEELLDIERGALLHDIGKIGVSDSILLKPGKLTEEEWERMRQHADLGAQILNGIRFLERARLVVQQHHERWDGQGYAQRLSKDGIYLGARIFAVIDTYDAMTSDRPYRRALGFDAAADEIRKGAGTQFDPGVVAAFCRIPREDLERIRGDASHPYAALD